MDEPINHPGIEALADAGSEIAGAIEALASDINDRESLALHAVRRAIKSISTYVCLNDSELEISLRAKRTQNIEGTVNENAIETKLDKADEVWNPV
jgi:hypothetical protein